jgi:hypothetical protein
MAGEGVLGVGPDSPGSVSWRPSGPPRWRPNLTDIPGLKAWYDPTDPAFVTTEGTAIVSIGPKEVPDSGLLSLGQIAPINRPILVDVDGKTVIQFFDSTQWLERAAAPLPDRELGLAMVLAWAVLDPNRGTSICKINRVSSPAQRVDLSVITATADFRYRFGTFGGDFGQADRPIPNSQWAITTTHDRTHWLNGGDEQTFASGSIGPSTDADLELGGFTGVAGHWIIVSGPTITDEQLRKLEGFVAHDLGIASVLVPGHPWKDAPP